MRHVILFLLFVSLFGAAACDGKATASDPSGAAKKPSSKEYETCSSSADCADGLRCLDAMCRRSARSNVADYYGARGAMLLSAHDVAGAVDAFSKAEARYEADHLAIPPELDCAYGVALAQAQADHEKAELGARVLHRCLSGVPAGSMLRDQALATMATLDGAGFEPSHLATDKPADRYLSNSPAAPSSDKLKVTVVASPATSSASFAAIADRVAQPDLRSALVACWQKYSDTAKTASLTVLLPIKVAYADSGYDDEPGGYVLKLDAAPAGSTPDAAAAGCVRAAIADAVSHVSGIRDGFQTSLKITIE
jgi:hypothetical protein